MNSYAPHDLYENLLKSIADPFFVIAEDGTYLDAFGGSERKLYDDAVSLKGRNIHDFMEAEFAQFFMEQVCRALSLGSIHCFEYQLQTDSVEGIPKNGPGGKQWFEARLYPLENLYEGKRAVTALILNISERKSLQQRLRELSYQDSLTKVFNRRYFFERLSEQLELYTQDRISLAIMVLDIDQFKDINDTYGHFSGDHILKQVVQVLEQFITPDITLARFGGDEFIFSVERLPFDEVMRSAECVRAAIEREKFVFAEHTIPVTVSIGVSQVTQFDTDTASIVSRADKALYLAKTQGRNRVVRM